MDGQDMALLRSLVAESGWPEAPCEVSPELAAQLDSPFETPGSTGYVLLSMASGRVFESGGDLVGRFPPGSLLKIPYAAALSAASLVDLAAELLASDTQKLLHRWPDLELGRLAVLLSPATGVPALVGPDKPIDTRGLLLGERAANGSYPLVANLIELGQILRASLWAQPRYFEMLRRNGSTEGSTLFAQSEFIQPLLALDAMAKTGTASDANGQPLVGHLMVAWPANHPVYLAVFRQRGIAGAGVLKTASAYLRTWHDRYPAQTAAVRVRLLSLTSPDSWSVEADCPSLTSRETVVSLCGHFRILSSARGSKTERHVSGVMHRLAAGVTLLETDAHTYASAVRAAEAPELKGSAREAMQAVIYWNGLHGQHRHGDTASLCDSSHCMVFQGEAGGDAGKPELQTDRKLVELLEGIARRNHLQWLQFSSGGDEKWERTLAKTEWSAVLGESAVLDIRRERHREGGVYLRVVYPDNEDVIACESFRNSFKLPSCPDEINLDPNDQSWHARGIGAGHGIGLSVQRARKLSESGRTAAEILVDAYGK